MDTMIQSIQWTKNWKKLTTKKIRILIQICQILKESIIFVRLLSFYKQYAFRRCVIALQIVLLFVVLSNFFLLIVLSTTFSSIHFRKLRKVTTLFPLPPYLHYISKISLPYYLLHLSDTKCKYYFHCYF